MQQRVVNVSFEPWLYDHRRYAYIKTLQYSHLPG